jgi:hypothetical protein
MRNEYIPDTKEDVNFELKTRKADPIVTNLAR